MTTHYKVHIIQTNANLKLTYRGGKFLRLEKINGKLSDAEIQRIGRIIPPLESQLNDFKMAFKNKLTYTKIEKTKFLFKLFTDAWFAFYEDFMGVKPRFNAVDGKHLKQIIQYLTELSQNETEALEFWNIILQNWKHLDDFHKQNTDLKYINSRINVILNNVKRNHKTGAKTVSSDYLQTIIRDLQS